MEPPHVVTRGQSRRILASPKQGPATPPRPVTPQTPQQTPSKDTAPPDGEGPSPSKRPRQLRARLMSEPLCNVCSQTVLETRRSPPAPLIACSQCDTCAHPFCLGLSDGAAKVVTTYDWKCHKCRLCERCGKAESPPALFVLCKSCDRCFHQDCLPPHAASKPYLERCDKCGGEDNKAAVLNGTAEPSEPDHEEEATPVDTPRRPRVTMHRGRHRNQTQCQNEPVKESPRKKQLPGSLHYKAGKMNGDISPAKRGRPRGKGSQEVPSEAGSETGSPRKQPTPPRPKGRPPGTNCHRVLREMPAANGQCPRDEEDRCPVPGCDSQGHLSGRFLTHTTIECCPVYHNMTAADCEEHCKARTKKKAERQQHYKLSLKKNGQTAEQKERYQSIMDQRKDKGSPRTRSKAGQ